MKVVVAVVLACLCVASVVGAPLKLINKRDIEKADAQYKSWKELVEATMNDNFLAFADDVARKCKFEADWEELGIRPDFNPASGKAFARVGKLKVPTSQKECIQFYNVCNGLYAVRKSFMSVAGKKTVRRHGAIGNDGAADYADREGGHAYSAWLAVMKAFLATKCDVRHPKCYRYISGNYTYDGKVEEDEEKKKDDD